MTKPTFDQFQASARKALDEICIPQIHLLLLDDKGALFHFYDDGGVDSLDMLDICFYIEKDLGIKLGLERLMHDDEPMTLQNLYDSIKQDTTASA